MNRSLSISGRLAVVAHDRLPRRVPDASALLRFDHERSSVEPVGIPERLEISGGRSLQEAASPIPAITTAAAALRIMASTGLRNYFAPRRKGSKWLVARAATYSSPWV